MRATSRICRAMSLMPAADVLSRFSKAADAVPPVISCSRDWQSFWLAFRISASRASRRSAAVRRMLFRCLAESRASVREAVRVSFTWAATVAKVLPSAVLDVVILLLCFLLLFFLLVLGGEDQKV